MLLLLFVPSSPAGPWRRAIMSVRAGKAAKKQAEKKIMDKEKAGELAKLRARYPKEMAEIDKLQAQNAAAAQQKLIALTKKYEKATGEKLKAIDAPKKPERKEPLRRILKNALERDTN